MKYDIRTVEAYALTCKDCRAQYVTSDPEEGHEWMEGHRCR